MKKSLNISLIHLFLFISLIFCNLIFLSSKSLFSIWIWLELSSLIIISYLLLNTKFYKNIIIIFIFQSISIIIFLFRLLLLISNKSIILSNYLILIFIISISLKIGLFPFILWYKLIIYNISWSNIFLFTTIFKIIPTFLTSSILPINYLFVLIILSSLTSSILIFQSINFKEIISYSSIFNSRWLIFILLINKKIWIICFLIYIINIFSLCKILKNLNINFININFKLLSSLNKFIYIFNIISLIGLPPFIGIILKIFISFSIINNINFFISLLFIIISLINIFSYFKFLNFSIFSYSNKFNFIINNHNNFNLNIYLTIIINLSLIILIFFF